MRTSILVASVASLLATALPVDHTKRAMVGVCPPYVGIVVLFPDSKDCTVYWRCTSTGPVKMPCAPGTWYNPILEVCTEPKNSGCLAKILSL